MKKNVAFMLSLVLGLSVVFTACGNKQETMTETKQETAAETKTEETKEAPVEESQKVFTLEELAQYNGKDGAKAYVAIEGVVYDLTDLPGWKEGTHNGYEAGKDLTEEMKKAPHGLSKLKGLPVVGTLEVK